MDMFTYLDKKKGKKVVEEQRCAPDVKSISMIEYIEKLHGKRLPLYQRIIIQRMYESNGSFAVLPFIPKESKVKYNNHMGLRSSVVMIDDTVLKEGELNYV